MEDGNNSDLLQDQDLIRLQNKSLGVCLCSAPKKLEFYGNISKPVVFHDLVHKYEKILNIPTIEENKTEVLRVGLTKCGFDGMMDELPSVLSAFRIIKLSRRISEFTNAEKANLKNRMIDPYLENTQDNQLRGINLGEPILLKSEINELYLGVRKITKQNLVLGSLENPSCEYLFVLSAKGRKSGVVSYSDSFEIKSFTGGRIVLTSNSPLLNVENLINEPNKEQIEDQDQLKVEERLEETYSRENYLKMLEPMNLTFPIKYCLRHFNAEPLSNFEKDLTQKLSKTFKLAIDYHFFLQDWGVVSGKVLKASLSGNNDQRIQEENFYYEYEEASETHDKLINKTNKLILMLSSLYNTMLHKNYISDFNWMTRQMSPALSLKTRQKALNDMAFFDYILLLVKLSLQKSYQSLDFEKVFKVKFDIERKKEVDTFARKNKMKRLLQAENVDWKLVRQTPQHVCRNELNRLLQVCLDLTYLGIKDNETNVRAVADQTDQFYYLLSFFKQTTRDILVEIAKYMVFEDENHVRGL